MNAPQRTYTAQCQLMTTAADPATAQAALALALPAINAAVATLEASNAGLQVAFQIETENGQIVLQEQ